jgi:hypothetical protein
VSDAPGEMSPGEGASYPAAEMTLRKLTVGEVLAGLAGAAAIAVLFGPWFGDENGWSAMTVLLVLVVLSALLGLALFVTTAFQRSQAYPVAAEVFGFSFSSITAFIILLELIFRDDPGWAAWAGFAAVAGIAAGSWIAMRRAVRR